MDEFLFWMTYPRVATNAGHGFLDVLRGFKVVDDVLVTPAAGVFGDTPAASLHLDRLVKFAGGKGERMKESMIGFGEIFGNEARRSMAVVASGHGAMAGFDPAIEMVLHDVAIGAGLGIVAEI